MSVDVLGSVSVLEIHDDPVTVEITGDNTGLVEVTAPPETITVEIPVAELIDVITAGPQGPRGDQGAPGVRGIPGPSPTYEMRFASATSVWIINHPLDARPTVDTYDLNGDEIIGDVSIPDNNTVIITFGMPFAGLAVLKA